MSNKASTDKNDKPPSTLQKALAFAVVLLVCALIYLLVSFQEEDQSVALISATPAPTTTPKPTLPPGVSQDVFLSRLEEAGLTLHEEDDGTYLVENEAGEGDVLTLYMLHGYVQGFSLTLPEKASKTITSPKGNISKYVAEKQQDLKKAQANRIMERLPKFLAALTDENDFPNSIALIWADEAAKVLESGKPVNESKHGISFTALRTQEEQLLISADVL